MNIITIDYNMCYVKGSLRNTMPIEKKIGSLSIKMFIKYSLFKLLENKLTTQRPKIQFYEI